MKTMINALLTLTLLLPITAFAGGWDKEKGLDQVTVEVELICVGCSLKKLSGANAQCSLYSQHDIGAKLADGSIYTIVNNQKGHDIIRGHGLLTHKKAKITGWLYPVANHIEIDSITVDGATAEQIAKAAWDEDQKVGNALISRKVGEAPVQKADAKHKH